MTEPLALISRAERMLAEATDITEVMDVRAMAKAAEAAAVALGLGEVAQKAKVFQLRAERKAGAYLVEHVRRGRPSAEPSENGRVLLADLDLTYNDSARWQTYAQMPEEKFNAYLDEHLSKGWEVTAGGMKSYARNLMGQPARPANIRGIYLVPPSGVCALRGFRTECSGPLTGQHILNKSKARGNEEVRALLVTCPAEIMATVCLSHNVDRWADTKDAQRILLLQKVWEFGYAHMSEFFRSLPWKVPQHDLTLEALLG